MPTAAEHPGSVFVDKAGDVRAICRLVSAPITIAVASVVATGLARVTTQRTSGHLYDLLFWPLALVCVLCSLFLLFRIVDADMKEPLAAMGLAFRKPALRDAPRGLLLGFLLIVMAYVVLRIAGDLTVNIFVSARSGELFLAGLAALAAYVMFQEVLLRGYAFQRIVELLERSDNPRRLRGLTPGSVTAAVVWSAACAVVIQLWTHGPSIWSYLNATLSGTLLCLAYLRTRSLWMPWGIHFGWNFTWGVFLGLPVAGGEFATFVRSEVVGPRG